MTFSHDPNSPFPILRHAAWKFLLRDLETSRFGHLIKAASERVPGEDRLTFAHLLLCPVAALAYLVAKSLPDLEHRESIDVMVFPGSGLASSDDGRWYQLLGPMLGDRIQIHVTIAQPDPDAPIGNKPVYPPRLQQALAVAEPSTSYFLAMEDYLIEGHAPDVVFFPFFPIAEEQEELFDQDHLPECLTRGSVLMGVNAETWAERDAAVALFQARHLGDALSVDQPFGTASLMGIPEDHSMAQYGWTVKPSSHEAMDIHWDRITEVEQFLQVFSHGMETTTGNPFAGQWLKLGQDPHGVLAGTRGRGINPKTRQMYRVDYAATGGYELEAIGEVPNHSPIDAPDESWSRMDMALHADDAMGVALFDKDLLKNMKSFLNPSGELGARMVENIMSKLNYSRERATAVVTKLNNAVSGESGVDAGLPLFVAAEQDDADGVRAASALGHDSNGRDGQGWTPLCTASDAGAINAAKALLDTGADVNAATTLGWRPLDYALSQFHPELAIALLEAGAVIAGDGTGAGSTKDILQSSRAPASILAWMAARGMKV